MIKSYFVVFVASAVLGILSGYMITTMLRESMQAELQLLAQQLPASSVTTNAPEADAGSPMYSWQEREKFLAQVAEVVKQAVVLSLQQHKELEGTRVLTQQGRPDSQAMQVKLTQGDQSEATATSIVIANEVLAAAIARGQWDAEDAQAYRDALQKVPADAQSEAYQQLSIAINNGDIQLVGDSPL